jgi:hypothetical protein
MMSSGTTGGVVLQKCSDVLQVLAASIIIAFMIDAVSTTETSVNSYNTTWRVVPEDSPVIV